jgi:hypothetical protein
MIAKQGAMLLVVVFLVFIVTALLVNFLVPGQFSSGSVTGSISPSSAFLVPINNVNSFPGAVHPFETVTVYGDVTSPYSDLTIFYVCRDSSCSSFYCTAKDYVQENIQKTFSCSFKVSSKLGRYNYYVRAVSGAYSNVVGPYSFAVS